MTGFPNRGIRRNNEEWEYEPDPMGRLGQGRWVPKQARDPFGRLSDELPPAMEEEDPKVGPLDLLAPVGPDQWNLSGDVERVEGMLMRTGHLAPDPIVTGRGEFMARQEQAIKSFQRDHGLLQDGLINPGGRTYETLVARLERMNDANSEKTQQERRLYRDGVSPIEGEQQVAAAPLVLGVPAAVDGTVILYHILMGAGLAATLSLRSDTAILEKSGESPKKDDSDHRTVYRGLVALTMLKPFFERKGNEETRRGNDIVIEECEKILNEEHPEFSERIKHLGGGTENGKGTVQVKETHIPNESNPDNRLKEGSFTDLTFGEEGAGKTRGHLNTISTLADGITPTPGERYQLEKLALRGEKIVRTLPKFRRAKWTEDENRDLAREACRGLMDELVREIERSEKGEE